MPGSNQIKEILFLHNYKQSFFLYLKFEVRFCYFMNFVGVLRKNDFYVCKMKLPTMIIIQNSKSFSIRKIFLEFIIAAIN